eukprot:364437-Chlamydomonas_euryale.AAC.6
MRVRQLCATTLRAHLDVGHLAVQLDVPLALVAAVPTKGCAPWAYVTCFDGHGRFVHLDAGLPEVLSAKLFKSGRRHDAIRASDWHHPITKQWLIP